VIHLLRHVDDRKDGTFEFRGEQGDEIDRAGRVEVRVRREAGEVVDLEIGGTAVAMLEGRFRL
jgi:predicted PhzF superfamily epimerase YddE/YHI9